MPVTVRLIDLVAIANTRPLWPLDFEALIAKLEEEPRTKAQWGVIADWCDGNDEPELANAFRWFHHHPRARVYRLKDETVWRDEYMPNSLSQYFDCDTQTLAGFAALLYKKLAHARAEAKKQLEELA